VLLAVGVVACGAEGAPISSDDIAVARSAIINGGPSPNTEDFAVKLKKLSGADRDGFACTGVLIAPTLMLTARHCVTDFVNSSETQCILGSDVPPVERFYVYVGSQATTVREYRIKRILFERDSTECNADIAGVELTEPVDGISFPPVELDSGMNVGDKIAAIGWGKTGDGEKDVPTERQRVEGRVLGTGAGTYPTQGGTRSIGDGFIISSLNGCTGDSGGPLVDSRGAVVAVIFGGLLVDTTAQSTVKLCAGAVTQGVPLSRHVRFIERLFQSTGKMPPRAGRPLPADLGGSCVKNNDCNSNYCVGVGTRSICSKTCTADAECGGSMACSDTGTGMSVCLDRTTPPAPYESCAAAPVRTSSPAFPGAVALGLGVLFVGRRKRRSAAREE
jgi:V8-like Glu-specific endopeptidase